MAQGRVTGVRETLAALKQFDPQLERDLRKEIRSIVSPLRSEAQRRIPSAPPLSGWTRGRYAFDGGAARAGVRVQVGGRASKRKRVWPLVTLKQTNAGGAVFDIAGRRSSGSSPAGRAFIAGLNRRHGRASRSMWKAAEGKLPQIRSEVEDAIEAASKTVNRKLKRVVSI